MGIDDETKCDKGQSPVTRSSVLLSYLDLFIPVQKYK